MQRRRRRMLAACETTSPLRARPDAASIAAMRFVADWTGRSVGPSTGTNVWGALRLVAGMRAAGRRGSVVTLICDGGERYAETGHDDIAPYAEALDRCMATGAWVEPPTPHCPTFVGPTAPSPPAPLDPNPQRR